MPRPRIPHRQIPLAIAAIFALLGSGWILLSDTLLLRLSSITPEQLTRYQTVKGLGFVLASALLIWWLVRRSLASVAEAEAARRESESRYRQIFEKTASVGLLIDVESLAIVDANPAAVRFYGWPRDQLIGKPLTGIDALPRDQLAGSIRAAAREERNLFVFRHRLHSGAERDVEVHASPIVLNGRPTLFSIVHDITDRLRTERQLVESEANYRRALEQASDAIVVSDPQGVILEVNARAEEILDCGREEIVGRRLEDFVSKEDPGKVPFHLADLPEGRSVLTERRLRRGGGGTVDVEVSARDLGDGRVQAIVRDVSERRRLEEQLLQAQKMEAVGQLTGGIAHDLNNVLTVVLANSEMMAAALPDGRDDLRADLGELQVTARRGAQMIRKLLSYSRHPSLSRQVLDLGLLTGGLIGAVRRMLPSEVQVHFHRDQAPMRVLADAGAMEQILLNLGTNARDAMPQGGTLRIDVSRVEVARPPTGAPAGWYACLSVADTGVGMEERVRARIFEPFFTTKQPGAGSGLGMAMIYGLTQQHGGFIELESVVGRGTTVRVFLPLTVEEEPVAAVAPPAGGLTGGPECILLVEDEEPLRGVAQRVLEKVGYRVLTACDGVEALEVFHRQPNDVDLVVTDVMMPRLGGIALYRALRQEGHRVRFLFTSGYAADAVMQGDFAEPELMLLQKPWSLADLTHRVREVLDRSR